MAELLRDVRLVNKKWFDSSDLPESEREERGTVSAEDALTGKVL